MKPILECTVYGVKDPVDQPEGEYVVFTEVNGRLVAIRCTEVTKGDGDTTGVWQGGVIVLVLDPEAKYQVVHQSLLETRRTQDDLVVETEAITRYVEYKLNKRLAEVTAHNAWLKQYQETQADQERYPSPPWPQDQVQNDRIPDDYDWKNIRPEDFGEN